MAPATRLSRPDPVAQPLTAAEADRILVKTFDSLQVSSEDGRDILLTLRGALVTKTTGEDFWTELERRLRYAALVSLVRKSQPGFYKNTRELLRSRGITADHPDVAYKAAMDTIVMRTI